MVDLPDCLAPEWAEVMKAFRGGRAERFLLPPGEKKVATPKVASPNRRARKRATRVKNAAPKPAEGPNKTEARKNIVAWASAAVQRLKPFEDANTYAGLSHRLRKFYEELFNTAESVGKEVGKEVGKYEWKYGYILAVRVHFALSDVD